AVVVAVVPAAGAVVKRGVAAEGLQAAAGVEGGVVADRATVQRRCAEVVQAAAVRGGVAGDGAIDQRGRAVVLQAAAAVAEGVAGGGGAPPDRRRGAPGHPGDPALFAPAALSRPPW